VCKQRKEVLTRPVTPEVAGSSPVTRAIVFSGLAVDSPLGFNFRLCRFRFLCRLRSNAVGSSPRLNTDADNQYAASDIPSLIAPIAEGRADLVVGARPIDRTEHFSALKKRLQRLGSHVARRLSNTSVRDATSGFRALNFEAAIRMHTFSDYTYTLETLIQAGRSGLRTELEPGRLGALGLP
jgi:hypothetical protein